MTRPRIAAFLLLTVLPALLSACGGQGTPQAADMFKIYANTESVRQGYFAAFFGTANPQVIEADNGERADSLSPFITGTSWRQNSDCQRAGQPFKLDGVYHKNNAGEEGNKIDYRYGGQTISWPYPTYASTVERQLLYRDGADIVDIQIRGNTPVQITDGDTTYAGFVQDGTMTLKAWSLTDSGECNYTSTPTQVNFTYSVKVYRKADGTWIKVGH